MILSNNTMPTPMYLFRCENSVLWWPRANNPIVNQSGSNTRCFRPLAYGFRFSFNFEFENRVSVVSLFRKSRPPAIFRRIVFRAFNSINRMQKGWRKSHVFKKETERIAPPFADRNTLPSVFFPTCAIGIKTPLLHTNPAIINFPTERIGTFSKNLSFWTAKVRHATTGARSLICYRSLVNFFFKATLTSGYNIAISFTPPQNSPEALHVFIIAF